MANLNHICKEASFDGENLICSNKEPAFFKGDNKKNENSSIKRSAVHIVNLNQTWHKAFLAGVDFKISSN